MEQTKQEIIFGITMRMEFEPNMQGQRAVLRQLKINVKAKRRKVHLPTFKSLVRLQLE